MNIPVKNGFLLTRQTQDQSSGIEVVLWVKTNDGAVKLVIENELALFFVETPQAQAAKSMLLNNAITLAKTCSLALKTFNQQKVTGFYFKYLRDFYSARACLKANNIKCYEDDFRPDERYLMERFITAGIDFIGKERDRSVKLVGFTPQDNTLTIDDEKLKYQLINNTKCKPQRCEITLSMVSIDIECAMDGTLYSIGVYI